MRKQELLKAKYSSLVSQTIDSPIMVFDIWELSDVFIALFIILVFGVLFYSWGTMFTLLSLCLGFGPVIKKKYPKGIFFHWPFSRLRMELPGLVNPKSNEQGAKTYDRKPNFNTRAKLSRDGRYWIIERVETWILPRKYLDVIAQNHAAERSEPQSPSPDAKPKRKGKRDANSDG